MGAIWFTMANEDSDLQESQAEITPFGTSSKNLRKVTKNTPLATLSGLAKVKALQARGGSHFKAEHFQPMPPLPQGQNL